MNGINMKKKYLLIIFLTASADLLVKAFVRRIPEGTVFFSMPPVFDFVHTKNTGAAFSMFHGNPMLVTALSMAMLGLMLVVLLKDSTFSRRALTALAVTIGGGMGNLVERLFFGSVTDYIRILLFRFPVFNLADIFVTLSVAYMMILLLTGKLEDKTEETHG